MKRYTQFDNLVIHDFEASEWEHPLHNHNHYELIFIAGGSGLHHLNGVKMPYRKGDLFLLGPEDVHEFIVGEKSRFIYFKFTRIYISEDTVSADWNKDIDQLLHHPARKEGNLLHNEEDRSMACNIFQLIVNEYNAQKLLHPRVIFKLFSIIILFIKRNRLDDSANEGGTVIRTGISEAIMEYIEMNIYYPRKLTLHALALHFHYSPGYIGLLFKEKTNTSLREYISNFRGKLIAQRLQQNNLSKKQIAAEFGFTDESHLHKFLKKHK